MSNGSPPQTTPAALCGLMKDAILQLCRSSLVYGGSIEVDGIICISGAQEGQQLVVKLHEKIGHQGSPAFKRDTHYNGDSCDQSIPAKRQRVSSPTRPVEVEEKIENNTQVPEKLVPSPLNENLGNGLQPYPKDDKDEDEEIDDDGSLSDGELDSKSGDTEVMDLTRKGSVDLSHDGGIAWPFYTTESRLKSLLTRGLLARSHGQFPFYGRRLPFNMPPIIQPPNPECKTCGLVIYDPELLREHNETQHGVFTCNVCYRTFTSRSNLERHSRLHTGHKPYICTKCGKAFSRKDHLTNHSAKHAFKCSKCLKRFVEKENLRQHYIRDHQTQMTDICVHCNKGFHDAHQYREHMKSHPEIYRRRGCLAPFDDSKINSGRESSLTPPLHDGKSPSPKLSPTSHPSTSSAPASPGEISDSSPGSSLSSLEKNSKHRQPHYFKYRCNECHMMYSSLQDLEQHKTNVHGQKVSLVFTCISCYESFDDGEAYSQHFAQHKDELNIFECSACRQILQSYSLLRSHEEQHLKEIKPKEEEEIDVVDTDESATYLCPYCAKVYPSESLLMEHVSIHEGLQRIKDGPGDSYDAQSDLDEPEVPLTVKIEKASPSKSPSPSRQGRHVRIHSEEDDDEFTVMDNPTPVIEIQPSGHDNSEDGIDKPFKIEGGSDSQSCNTPCGQSEDSADGISQWVNIKNHKYSYSVPVPEASFMCSLCSCIIPSFKEYEGHCFSAHYRYPCMYCHKTFAQRPNRDRHVCIHTGEKPFDCPECNLKFSRGDKLKIHRIKVHKLEYPGPYVRLSSGGSGGKSVASND